MTRDIGIWEIAVLALLREAPMHPYRMQRLLRDRHKDEILALKRGSLYHAIGRLARDGLIEAAATGRDGRRPERTTYRITAAGQKGLTSALRQMISIPRRESSEFMAAMSFLVHIKPEDAIPHLEERCQHLEDEIERCSVGIRGASAWLERIHLIESEYLIAMLQAELKWVRKLVVDIRKSKLVWDLKKILADVRLVVKAAGLEKR